MDYREALRACHAEVSDTSNTRRARCRSHRLSEADGVSDPVCRGVSVLLSGPLPSAVVLSAAPDDPTHRFLVSSQTLVVAARVRMGSGSGLDLSVTAVSP